jgi:hypothetical protein
MITFDYGGRGLGVRAGDYLIKNSLFFRIITKFYSFSEQFAEFQF